MIMLTTAASITMATTPTDIPAPTAVVGKEAEVGFDIARVGLTAV